MSKNVQFIKGFSIAIIVAGILSALLIISGDTFSFASDGITARLFLICLSFILFSLTFVAGLVVAEKPPYKTLGNAAMIVSGVAFLLIVILIFTGVDDNLGIIKLAIILFIVAFALAHLSVLYHFNLNNKNAIMARTLAMVFLSIYTFISIINVLNSGSGFPGLFGGDQTTLKLGLASTILSYAATALVPLFNRFPKEATPISNVEEIKPVTENYETETVQTAPVFPPMDDITTKE